MKSLKVIYLVGFISMGICLISACTPDTQEMSRPYIGKASNPTSRISVNSVIEVEGCEYFVINAHSSYTYLHKGNCKNPIHPYNK